MSTCNCDGTVSISFTETLFGDSVINSLGIYESMFGLNGAADPRIPACEQAAGTLRAQGQDPCNLDSPDDLQVLYHGNIASAWAVIKGAPVTNSLQAALDVAAGTATSSTPGVAKPPAPPSAPNYLFIIGAIVIVAFGFLLVFR